MYGSENSLGVPFEVVVNVQPLLYKFAKNYNVNSGKIEKIEDLKEFIMKKV